MDQVNEKLKNIPIPKLESEGIVKDCTSGFFNIGQNQKAKSD